MLARARAAGARTTVDVGCGEGRFVRILKAEGIEAIGLDPTPSLIAKSRARDPDGVYVEAGGEALPFPDQNFDLVESSLSFVNIEDYTKAIAEMVQVLIMDERLLGSLARHPHQEPPSSVVIPNAGLSRPRPDPHPLR